MVINLSKTPLTEVEESLLAHGPNFTVAPRHPQHLEYITAIEIMCHKFDNKGYFEVKMDINRILIRSDQQKIQPKQGRMQGHTRAKRDKNTFIFTVANGVTMVVMDKQEYFNQAENIIEQPAHRSISTDFRNKCQAKLIYVLKRIKKESGLDNNTHMSMYPMLACSPK